MSKQDQPEVTFLFGSKGKAPFTPSENVEQTPEEKYATESFEYLNSLPGGIEATLSFWRQKSLLNDQIEGTQIYASGQAPKEETVLYGSSTSSPEDQYRTDIFHHFNNLPGGIKVILDFWKNLRSQNPSQVEQTTVINRRQLSQQVENTLMPPELKGAKEIQVGETVPSDKFVQLPATNHYGSGHLIKLGGTGVALQWFMLNVEVNEIVVINTSTSNQKHIKITPGKVTKIGRSLAPLRASEGISREHLDIISYRGLVYIRDNNSTNGSFYQGLVATGEDDEDAKIFDSEELHRYLKQEQSGSPSEDQVGENPQNLEVVETITREKKIPLMIKQIHAFKIGETYLKISASSSLEGPIAVTSFVPNQNDPEQVTSGLYTYIAQGGKQTIGRDKSCDITLRDIRISRKHLTIEILPGKKKSFLSKAIPPTLIVTSLKGSENPVQYLGTESY